MTVGVYAGSFDPFTYGHLAVAVNALKGLDYLHIAVGHNPAKKGLFTVEERKNFISHEMGSNPSVVVDHFEGALVSYCRKLQKSYGCPVVIVRGLRAVSDFEQEMAIAYANSIVDPQIQTFFIPATSEHAFVSSSGAKQLALFPEAEGALAKYVSPGVAEALKEKLRP